MCNVRVRAYVRVFVVMVYVCACMFVAVVSVFAYVTICGVCGVCGMFDIHTKLL